MPYALQARQAREMDKHAVLCMLTKLSSSSCPSNSFHPHSARSREVVASLPNKGRPPRRRVSRRTSQFDRQNGNTDGVLHLVYLSRARQMRLPTAYKPVLAHRPNPPPPRHRHLLPSSPARPSSPDEAGAQADHSRPTRPPTTPSILQPKPRTAVGGASPGGRPTIFPSVRRERSVDGAREYCGARREPSPARSAVSQPPAVSCGPGVDSEARVSLWAELKDIRKRTRTPGGTMVPSG